MTPSLTYWIVAWCLMALTFVTATAAILLGAKGLDRDNQYPGDDL